MTRFPSLMSRMPSPRSTSALRSSGGPGSAGQRAPPSRTRSSACKSGISAFIHASDRKLDNANVLGMLVLEACSFHATDQACLDFERLHHLNVCDRSFVLRVKSNTGLLRLSFQPLGHSTDSADSPAARPHRTRSWLTGPCQGRRREPRTDRGRGDDTLVPEPAALAERQWTQPHLIRRDSISNCRRRPILSPKKVHAAAHRLRPKWLCPTQVLSGRARTP